MEQSYDVSTKIKQSELLEVVRANFDAEDVFGADALRAWAEENGYKHEDNINEAQ